MTVPSTTTGMYFFAHYGTKAPSAKEVAALARLKGDLKTAVPVDGGGLGSSVAFTSEPALRHAIVPRSDVPILERRLAVLAKERMSCVRPAVEFHGRRPMKRLEEIVKVALAHRDFLATPQGRRRLEHSLNEADRRYRDDRWGGAALGAIMGATFLTVALVGVDLASNQFNSSHDPPLSWMALGSTLFGLCAGLYLTQGSPSYVAHCAVTGNLPNQAVPPSPVGGELPKVLGDQVAYFSADTGDERPLELIVDGGRSAYLYAPFATDS